MTAKVSYSRLKQFIDCPCCIWLLNKGIPDKSCPTFAINQATDDLLKRDFQNFDSELFEFLQLDEFEPIEANKLHTWQKATSYGLQCYHTSTNMLVGGGIDFVLRNKKTKKIHVFDFKSTSSVNKNRELEINFNSPYKKTMFKQLEFYVWILRQIGEDVSDTAYIFYVNGDKTAKGMFVKNGSGFQASINFKHTIHLHQCDTSWVPLALHKYRNMLDGNIPSHSESCRIGQRFKYEQEQRQLATTDSITNIKNEWLLLAIWVFIAIEIVLYHV